MIEVKGDAMWILLVVTVLAILVTLGIVVWRLRPSPPPSDVDPLFTAGIAISGASAALIATLGAAMIPMLLVGLACIVVGAHRSRAGDQ
jgi:uncharacterized membrane protein